jgi:hypothetical protein
MSLTRILKPIHEFIQSGGIIVCIDGSVKCSHTLVPEHSGQCPGQCRDGVSEASHFTFLSKFCVGIISFVLFKPLRSVIWVSSMFHFRIVFLFFIFAVCNHSCLGPLASSHVIEAAGRSTSLMCVDLSNNLIGEQGIAAVSRLLSKPKRVRRLIIAPDGPWSFRAWQTLLDCIHVAGSEMQLADLNAVDALLHESVKALTSKKQDEVGELVVIDLNVKQ